MTGLAGTGALARLAMRRDRIGLPVALYLITAVVAGNTYSLRHLYPTPAARVSLAASGGSNPSFLFLYGRLEGTSLGAVSAWRYAVWAAIFASLMSIFLVVRHTRADEEAGRLELVGSAAVGRHAPLTAGLAVASAASGVLAAALAVVLILLGLPAGGSVAFALAITTCSLAFAFVTALAAQLVPGARAARGIAIAALGAAFLLRAIGDAAGAHGPSWLTWLSPLGWTELTRAYAGDRWWVLALPVALSLAAGAGAYALAAIRDHGAGLVPYRPGRPRAGAALRGPLGLAWRLQRATLSAWALGFAVTFAASGAAAKGIGGLFGGSQQLREAFLRMGGQPGITNAYLAALMSLAGLGAAAYATSAVLRLRSEETAQLAEPVLAAGTGRARWVLSHVTVALAGTAALLALGGAAAGLGYGLRAGNLGTEVGRLAAAAIAQLPASLAIAAVAAAAFGLLPRAATALGWSVTGAVFVIGWFGEVLRFPRWLLDVSPFTHVPKLPGGTVTAAPLLWLSGIAAALCVAALASFRRRDVG
ncbi:MAG: ABC transporter permease [Nocardiopsaceae bacterium]|jgi:ABC-2 type transport system permease protein|nr:ABC transporter permease [Nocardiopsaceae bacterium]